MGLAKNLDPPLGKEYQNATFVPVSDLPEMAFDHQEIIEYAVNRLRSKIMYTNAVFALMPSHFTLTELQIVYEAILDHPIDKRNFRKKVLSLDMISATEMKTTSGAHRPAKLYKFNHSILRDITRNLD